MFERVIHTVFTFLFPPRCLGCGARDTIACDSCVARSYTRQDLCLFCKIPAQKGICSTCHDTYALDAVSWTFAYRSPIGEPLIENLKYRRKRFLAKTAADFIRPNIHATTSNDTFLLPIPLYPTRERERGFNQAREIAHHIGLPLLPANILVRTKQTSPQARTRSRKERFENIRGAFSVPDRTLVEGKTILLVDDVSTTGATISEAARTLRNAGAQSVSAVVVAHG